MKNIKYIHKTFEHTNKVIDLQSLISANMDVKELNKFLKDNKLNSIKLYHGTSSEHDIINEGILATNKKNKKILQSEVGYTYFSIYPEYAKKLGRFAYPDSLAEIKVYEVTVPIEYLKPDKNQLFNVNISGNLDLAHSAIYGNCFKIKGSIPPYMIREYITQENFD